MPVNANTEYKMSALLTALQEFDTAIEQQNVRSARQALGIVRKVAAIDDRFQTALRESITRLQDLEASAPPDSALPSLPRRRRPSRSPLRLANSRRRASIRRRPSLHDRLSRRLRPVRPLVLGLPNQRPLRRARQLKTRREGSTRSRVVTQLRFSAG